MHRLILLLLVLSTLIPGVAFAAHDTLSPPPVAIHGGPVAPQTKDHAVRVNPGTPDEREGGETILDPFPIEILPFTDIGNTCDNIDDYDEACPYTGSFSPDVVYVYVPFEDHLLKIDLCGSSFDTKVFVYENNHTPGNPYACNDDYYPAGDICGSYVSRIDGLQVLAGVPYFIVIDGWGGDCGDYQLQLDYDIPQSQFDITFSQLTFGYEGFEDVEFSSIGRVRFDFETPQQMGFLNMAAYIPGSEFSEWNVHNLIIPDITMGPPYEMLAARFPMEGMSVVNGQPVTEIIYGYTITPYPLVDDDLYTWYDGLVFNQMPVQQERVETHGYDAPGNAPMIDISILSWWLPSIPPIDVTINSWIGCDMPNTQLDSTQAALDWNGCAPASCANSLKWLEDKHDEIDFPPNLRQVFEQLSNLMNRLAGQGAGPEQILKAKLDFIEAYGLPIHVKYQAEDLEGNFPSSTGETTATDSDGAAGAFPTRAWIESESAAGEDVEIGVGFYYMDGDELKRDGGHAVVVTGTGTVNNVPKIAYKHDTHQEDGTGQEQEVSDIDEIGGPGGLVHLPGLDGWIRPAPGADPVRTYAIVEAVFSESYDPSVTPVSGSHTYSEYCQWFKRTIAPGKKLKITYPSNASRCFNATIWRLDRTVQPARWIKVQVWNFNSGQTREWVNTYDYPVTVAVHNDDHYESAGEYVPYEVELQFLAVVPGETSSPSNETAYGGFSLGGADGASIEFGSVASLDVVVDASLGLDLSTVPSRLTTDGTGTQSLQLNHPIPVWNDFWENLAVVIRVAEVANPGELDVLNLTTGDYQTILIDSPGMYVIELAPMLASPVFELVLQANSNLDLSFDSIGVPSTTLITSVVGHPDVPQLLSLEAAYPNPFNPATTIRFGLPVAGSVKLGIYDISGKLVADLVSGELLAGRHEAVWLGVDQAGLPAATGVYIFRLEAGGEVLSGKMTIMK